MTQFDDYSPSTIDDQHKASAPGIGGRLLVRMLRGIHHGRILITLPSGKVIEKTGTFDGPDARMVIHRWRMLPRLVFGGDIGFAESFMDGDWTSPDLTTLIRFAARNTEALEREIRGNGIVRLLNRLRHRLRPNSRSGARRNIEAHYDLGNAFYSQWLDASMQYSSAIYERDDDTLEIAEERKLARIADLLGSKPGDRVLEIGCGWGALSRHLASVCGAEMTGITLSPSQLDWARRTIAEAGLGDKVDLRLQDYRDLDEQFDGIVSIEMFEAVGEEYWPAYFDTLKKSLKPGGKAVLQIISIEEGRYENYRRDTDFIQKHVFPGGFLPSKTALAEQVRRSGLSISKSEYFGLSYARTLRDWRLRFKARWNAIAPLGFDQRFHHLWDYYLSYCEAGFLEGSIDVGLYVLAHDDAAGGRSAP